MRQGTVSPPFDPMPCAHHFWNGPEGRGKSTWVSLAWASLSPEQIGHPVLDSSSKVVDEPEACQWTERPRCLRWKAPRQNRDNYWPWGARWETSQIGPLRPLDSTRFLSSCLPVAVGSFEFSFWLIPLFYPLVGGNQTFPSSTPVFHV